MNIVFFGSDDFAAVNLNRLLASSHSVAGCVTQPDKPQGRGMQIAISPIKEIALAHDVPYVQPATLKDPSVVSRLKEFKADVFVVVAYGKLLSAEILSIPKIFCVNVHGSLLPKYRGAAPINWAILNGDAKTGVTVQKMDITLDAGDIIAQVPMNITPDMTSVELRAAMAKHGADLLVETLDAIEHGKHKLTPQDNSKVTFAPKLTKDMGRIVWSDPAAKIHDQVRGLQPWPGTHTFYNGKMVKVLSCAVVAGAGKPGTVLAIDQWGLTISCGEKALLIQEVQPEAGKAMSSSSFTAGYKIQCGSLLGQRSGF